jgi:hypothetical protein
MPISRLDQFMEDEKTAEIFDHYQRVRGYVPKMFRTIAHPPEIMRSMVAHFRSVTETGTLSQKLKELGIVRTSQINRYEY